MLQMLPEVYSKASELHNPYGIILELKSIQDVSKNVVNIFKKIWGASRVHLLKENRAERSNPLNNIIICGSSCMLAWLESQPGLKSRLRSSKTFPEIHKQALLNKIPNDIDAVASSQTWNLLCTWGKSSEIAWLEASANNDNIRVGIVNRNLKGEGKDPLIEIYPSWSSFSDDSSGKHGREWVFEKIYADSIIFEGVRYLGPLHTLADKVIRYRPKDKAILVAFKELLIFADEKKYGFLRGMDLSTIIGRVKFVDKLSKEGLFLNKGYHDRRIAVSFILENYRRLSPIIDKNVAKYLPKLN